MFCNAILELEKRGYKTIKRVWDIYPTNSEQSDEVSIDVTDAKSFMPFDAIKLKKAIEKWVTLLANEYISCYEKIFKKNHTFLYNYHVQSGIIVHKDERPWGAWIELKSIIESANGFSIEYNESAINKEYWYDTLRRPCSFSKGIFPLSHTSLCSLSAHLLVSRFFVVQ